ncbi:Fic family protein [Haliscomenobacter sp.]|uniref:Fic family protein n=1 Tax=Haliscomenobacter sp. TaxID=2717303 RepID=UPI003594116D
MYNWQQNDWLHFRYDEAAFTEIALSFMAIAGQSLGYLQGLSGEEQAESIVSILVKEAIKTSSIEGEFISRVDVISSIRKNLGYTTPSYHIKDKRSEGIATLLVKAREDFDSDFTEAVLFEWHQSLMLGNTSIHVGQYRNHPEPMQVISGAIGREVVHFEAPPSAQVPAEMQAFFEWFNATKPDEKSPIPNLLIRAAIAHLYFETIHPFEDGNGRIGRVIAEKALAQGLKRPILMSLSTAIEADKKAYYAALKKAQRTNDLTEWIQYFSETILKAQLEFIETIDFLLKKTTFFDKHQAKLNEAQCKVLNRMLEEGEENFKGGMNARKYQSISKVSKATATRHLQDLVEKGILIVQKGGRSTHYQVNLG